MNNAFTLLEVLVALLLLSIVASVVLETQLSALKAEQAARAAQQVRREADRIVSEVRLGNALTNILAAAAPECSVQTLTLQSNSPAAAPGLRQWEISAKERPSASLIIFSRFDE